MRRSNTRTSAFTLLELLMAMGLFAIAAVSLAQALNLISLSVSESIDDSDIREQMRGVLMEASRDPNLEVGSRTIQSTPGVLFEIDVSRVLLENRETLPLNDLFEIKITAKKLEGGLHSEVVATADTWVYKNLFEGS